MKANFKKTYIPLAVGKGVITIEINRGQLIFGRFKAEEELGMDGSMIYRTLKKFEELEQISIQANNQYSLITICNYDSYQNNNCDSEQPMNNQRTTDEQHVNTLKEGKEGKEVFIYNRNFKKEDIINLPENIVYNICVKFKSLKQVTIDQKKIYELWEVFLNENLEIKEYNKIAEIYTHFSNWILKQKFETNDNRTNQEKQIDAMHKFIYGSSGTKNS
jgi:hypothetical protein